MGIEEEEAEAGVEVVGAALETGMRIRMRMRLGRVEGRRQVVEEEKDEERGEEDKRAVEVVVVVAAAAALIMLLL